MSLTFFKGLILTTLWADLSLKIVSSPVNGLIFLCSLVVDFRYPYRLYDSTVCVNISFDSEKYSPLKKGFYYDPQQIRRHYQVVTHDRGEDKREEIRLTKVMVYVPLEVSSCFHKFL